MHPDISHLIRPTYPQLLDAPSTLERSPVRGLPDNLRIAFVSHNKTEGAGDDAPEETTVSYTNSHEAEMTAQIVEYFKKQGYKEDQLVVLTPYLGQLRLLMNCLREAIISGRDATDLRADDPNANLDTDKIQKDQNKKGVRVSSIDNYQVCLAPKKGTFVKKACLAKHSSSY
jgi:superfamily I DNA and/or RNA helicase